MNHNDFFAKVDASLRKETDAAALESAAKGLEFVKQVIARLTPVAASYEAQLKKRKINAKADYSPTGITFTLRYKDGDENELYVGGVTGSDLIELNTSYTESDNKYAATRSYNSIKWSDDFFEIRLQRLIDDFVRYEDKHSGI